MTRSRGEEVSKAITSFAGVQYPLNCQRFAVSAKKSMHKYGQTLKTHTNTLKSAFSYSHKYAKTNKYETVTLAEHGNSAEIEEKNVASKDVAQKTK